MNIGFALPPFYSKTSQPSLNSQGTSVRLKYNAVIMWICWGSMTAVLDWILIQSKQRLSNSSEREACSGSNEGYFRSMLYILLSQWKCCRCYPILVPFLFLCSNGYWSAVTCVLLFLLISLCFSHSLLVNCLPLWPGVFAWAEWVLFSAGGRPESHRLPVLHE